MARDADPLRWDPIDPLQLPAHERLEEITAILAAGARRALAIHQSSPMPEMPQESNPIRLDVLPQTRLHGARRVNATREDERR